MKAKIITATEELDAFKAEWNGLLKRSLSDVVHLSHEWVTAWWHNFGKGKELCVITVYNDRGELLGIAPLMRSAQSYRNIHVKKVSLLANGHSPSSNIIVSRENPEEVVDFMAERMLAMTDWDIMELTKVDQKNLACELFLNNLKKRNQPYGVKSNIESPFITIDSDWEAFFDRKSKRFKKSMRNKINRADKFEDISINRINIRGGRDAVIGDMISVSGKSWKKKNGADLHTNNEAQGFYLDICDNLGPSGNIMVWMLSKGATPVAFEFHITYNGVVYPIRADYDDAFKSLSPGSVLEYNIIKTLFEESKVREYNSCGHTYDYLLNWTDCTRKLINVEIFNSGCRSYSLYALEYKLIPILRKYKIKNIKHLFRPVQGNMGK